MAMSCTYIKYVCTFTIFKTFTLSQVMYTAKSLNVGADEICQRLLKLRDNVPNLGQKGVRVPPCESQCYTRNRGEGQQHK